MSEIKIEAWENRNGLGTAKFNLCFIPFTAMFCQFYGYLQKLCTMSIICTFITSRISYINILENLIK